jgi:peroxiredoxin
MISQDAYYSDDEEKMNICRELFAKVPKDYMSESIYFVKKYLYPEIKPLKAGDQVKDFTLNDHDGKPHSIMEYAGKGKYLLLESARKACTGEVLDRPKEYLKELHKKYADKFDVVTLAISPKEMFDDKEFPREDWLELGLNETSPFEEIMSTYFPKEERFVFISPEGKILAKCRPDKLNEEIKKCFPFVE